MFAEIPAERLRSYMRKLDHMLTRISNIEEWLEGMTVDEFLRDLKTKLAVYKAFQEVVDAAMDICAMMCKDLGIAPSDDYTNISRLAEVGVSDQRLREALTRANGLRNRPVHHYNKLDDRIAYESIRELIPSLVRFAEVIEEWISRRSSRG